MDSEIGRGSPNRVGQLCIHVSRFLHSISLKYKIGGKTEKVRGESGEDIPQFTGCSLGSLSFLYLGQCLATPKKPITFQSRKF